MPYIYSFCTLFLCLIFAIIQVSNEAQNERMVTMIEKIMILHELKLAGFDISANLEKMYQKYGKEEFQRAAQASGYGFIFE